MKVRIYLITDYASYVSITALITSVINCFTSLHLTLWFNNRIHYNIRQSDTILNRFTALLSEFSSN